jgi:hypothetical protein
MNPFPIVLGADFAGVVGCGSEPWRKTSLEHPWLNARN